MYLDSLSTSLDKTIDKTIDKYNKKLGCRTYNVKKGDESILSAAYGININEEKKQWCFRSAKENELHEYNEIYQPRKFSNSDEFDTTLYEMMDGIVNAVNNNDYDNIYKSYSKCLAAPLFKYNYGNNPLIINKLDLNTLDVMIQVDCFNWHGDKGMSCDIYGNEMEQYHAEFLNENISFKELTSKGKLFEKVEEFVDNEIPVEDMYVDNITVSIDDITIDISEVGRNNFDKYFKDERLTQFKRHASYKKDLEVITTRGEYGYNFAYVKNKNILQLIRYMYILKLNYCYTGEINLFISTILKNKYKDIITFCEEDIRSFRMFYTYLSNEQNINYERKNYRNIFNNIEGEKWAIFIDKGMSCMKQDSLKLLERLYKNRCFEETFFTWIYNKTKELWKL